MCKLLEKEAKFVFGVDCHEAFKNFKKKLVEAPILIAPDWELPFELMCDASDIVVGEVLGQIKKKIFDRSTMLASIKEEFLDEKLLSLDTVEFPWYADIVNLISSVDYVSKWVKAMASLTNDARVVMKFVKKNIFSRFGTPREIISDGGTHFINTWFKNILAKYGVRHKVATSYHPQTSEQVERKDWAKKLDDALWAYQTTFKMPIRTSPYLLVYGKACHIPVELEHQAYWVVKKLNFEMTAAGERRNLLCGQRSSSSWTRHRVTSLHSLFPYTQMNKEARIWGRIVYSSLIQGKHMTEVTWDRKISGASGPISTMLERQTRTDKVLGRLYGLMMMISKTGGIPTTPKALHVVELDYPLSHHSRTMLMIGLDFVKSVDDDVPTDEEHRYRDSDMKSDEEDQSDNNEADDDSDDIDETPEDMTAILVTLWTMLRIGPDFVESVDDDVPTDEEHRYRDSDMKSDEEDQSDDEGADDDSDDMDGTPEDMTATVPFN
ncbi:putative serine/threonine-protein phosphatase 7 long form -like protein [Capsicum annuum]|nr:putative serine/threonine-protein phosphatase 7 long form -like protein [Capsicum annuum]